MLLNVISAELFCMHTCLYLNTIIFRSNTASFVRVYTLSTTKRAFSERARMASTFSALMDCFSLAHAQLFGDNESTTEMANNKRLKIAHLRSRASLYADTGDFEATLGNKGHPMQILSMWSDTTDWRDICEDSSNSDVAPPAKVNDDSGDDWNEQTPPRSVTPLYDVSDVPLSPAEFTSSAQTIHFSPMMPSCSVLLGERRQSSIQSQNTIEHAGSLQNVEDPMDCDSTAGELVFSTDETSQVRTRRLQSVFNVARRWRISAEDAAEIMANVERAASPEGKLFGPEATLLSRMDHRQCIKC